MEEKLEVLIMDDGYTSVVAKGTVPADATFVEVSGVDKDVYGVRSYGDVVCPVGSFTVSKSRVSDKMALSDCFRGIHGSLFMWGRRGTYKDVHALGGIYIDQTSIDLEEGERLACVTADKFGRLHVFLDDGMEVKNPKCAKISQLCTLENYYTFCGVLSANGSKFTAHCVWNSNQCCPVGPPFDRRIAEFVHIDFAPVGPVFDKPPRYVMVRVDNNLPIVIITQK
jgi:hypothetical protein